MTVITHFWKRLSFWLLRAPLAVVGGVLIGQIAQIPFAFFLDLMWQHDVTGGRWPLTLPNVLLTCLGGVVTGFTAGWVAGKHGKLLAAVATFLPLLLFIIVSLIKNVDSTAYFQRTYDTKPALWAWIALIPSIVGGHFGSLDGKRYFNHTSTFCGLGFLRLAYTGFGLFHLYTTFIAFEMAGFIAAFITFGFPLVSELYWLWHIWRESGQFLNHYTSLALLLVVFVLIAGVAGIASAMTKKWVEGDDVL